MKNSTGWNSIAEYEFRSTLGLDRLHQITPCCDPSIPSSSFTSSPSIADMIIPLKKGILSFLPTTYPNSNIEYIRVSKIGTVYQGYNINAINTCARFISHNQHDAEHDAEHVSEKDLNEAAKWFNALARYDPVPIAEIVKKISEVAIESPSRSQLDQSFGKESETATSFKQQVANVLGKRI